jgi:hypothetical protein
VPLGLVVWKRKDGEIQFGSGGLRYRQVGGVLLFCLFGQRLTVLLRLAPNLQSSCLSLQSAGITGMCHHTWLPSIAFDT